jgi:hypothetical protein
MLAIGDLAVVERWPVKPMLYPMPMIGGAVLTAGHYCQA